MIYNDTLSGTTLKDMVKAVQEGPAGAIPSIWDSKYLPVAIGFVGVTAAFLIGGIIKKRKKRKK